MKSFLALCLSLLSVVSVSGAVSVSSPTGAVSKFKEFLSNPPNISEMVAKICEPDATNNDVHCYYVLLRYQSNAFFYREAPDLVGLSSTNFYNGLRLSGYYDDLYWDFSLDGRSIQITSNRAPDMQKTLEHELCKASPLLNLGLNGSLPRSVKWDGNRIKPYTNHYGVKIQGSLHMDESLESNQVQLTLSTEGRVIPWRIDYDFSGRDTLPEYIPSRISAWALLGGTRLRYEVHILVAKISDLPLSKEYFLPNSFKSEVIHQIEYGPNATVARNLMTGKAQSVAQPLPVFSRKTILGMVIGLILVLVVTFLVFCSHKTTD